MASKKIACRKFAVLCQLHLLCSPPKKLKAGGHVPALYIGQVTRKPGARIVHCLAGQCSIIIVLKPTLGAGLTRQAGNLQAFIY